MRQFPRWLRPLDNELWVLAIVFFTLTSSTVAWTWYNRTPPPWDPSDHIRTAYAYYRPLAHGQIAAFFYEVFQKPHPYPPLYHCVTAVVFLVFGVSRLTAITLNFIALAVLLFSVKRIGDQLHAPGVIAALLTACYHFPAWLIHDAFLDYLLIALVALAFALLLQAGEFHVRRDAVIFGIAAGIGMLAKQTFPFFFILPGAFLFFRALLRRDRGALANLLLSASIVAAIASVWYIPHLGDVSRIYSVNVEHAAVEDDPSVFSRLSLGYYWAVLLDLHLQLPFSFLFIGSVIYSVRRRLQQDWMLYLWIFSGMLAFTLIANKDTRYAAPILPAVALISVSWLGSVRRGIRVSMAAGLMLWAFISFFNTQWPAKERDATFHVLGAPIYVLAGNTVRFDHQPLPDDWGIPEIVRKAADKPSRRLGVVPNIWQLNPSNVALYAQLLAGGRGAPPLVEVDSLLDKTALDRVDRCDYVIARTHLETAEQVASMEVVLDRYLRETPDRYRPVAVFALPNFQEAVLYKRSRD